MCVSVIIISSNTVCEGGRKRVGKDICPLSVELTVLSVFKKRIEKEKKKKFGRERDLSIEVLKCSKSIFSDLILSDHFVVNTWTDSLWIAYCARWNLAKACMKYQSRTIAL